MRNYLDQNRLSQLVQRLSYSLKSHTSNKLTFTNKMLNNPYNFTTSEAVVDYAYSKQEIEDIREHDSEIISKALVDLDERLGVIEDIDPRDTNRVIAAALTDLDTRIFNANQKLKSSKQEIEDINNQHKVISAALNDQNNRLNQQQVEINSKQDILIPGRGIKIEDNVIINTATEEVVELWVHSDIASVEGLQVNVYYNKESDPSQTLILDENGRASIEVPHDYLYKLSFPKIEGCADIPPIIHLSSLPQRSVEIEYVGETDDVEEVRITVKKRDVGKIFTVPNKEVIVTIDDASTTYTTDSNGVVVITVPIGFEYSIEVGNEENYITPSKQAFKASRLSRGVSMIYRYSTISGLYIVDKTNTEYTPEEFYTLVESGLKENNDAVFIEVITDTLVDNGGVFNISIDMIAFESYPNNNKWASSNVEFTSIPVASGVSAPYYYDGFTASKLIQAEGDNRSIQTPAVDACLELTMEIDNHTYQGFLGSIGQWRALWENVYAIDDIISVVRPDFVSLLSSRTGTKWSTTQNHPIQVTVWTTTHTYREKTSSWAIVPFFAF